MNKNKVEERRLFLELVQQKIIKHDENEKPNLQKTKSQLIDTIKWRDQCILDFYVENTNFTYPNSANLLYVFYVYPTAPGFKQELFDFLLKDMYIHNAVRKTDVLIEIYLVLKETESSKKREFWMNSYHIQKDTLWQPFNFFVSHWGKMTEEAAIKKAYCIRLEIYHVPEKFDMYFYVSRFVKTTVK